MLVAIINKFNKHFNNIKSSYKYEYNVFLLSVKFTISMFLIGDFETVFSREFVDVCMIYLRAKFHLPDSNGSLVITVKPIDKYRFPAAAFLLSYTLEKRNRLSNNCILFRGYELGN
jgi:hypothetical protein